MLPTFTMGIYRKTNSLFGVICKLLFNELPPKLNLNSSNQSFFLQRFQTSTNRGVFLRFVLNGLAKNHFSYIFRRHLRLNFQKFQNHPLIS